MGDALLAAALGIASPSFGLELPIYILVLVLGGAAGFFLATGAVRDPEGRAAMPVFAPSAADQAVHKVFEIAFTRLEDYLIFDFKLAESWELGHASAVFRAQRS